MPKKATQLPIHHKYVEMIFNGTKKYELRNYPVEGRIYFYETKGKLLGYAIKITSVCQKVQEYLDKIIGSLDENKFEELFFKDDFTEYEKELFNSRNFYVNNSNENAVTGSFELLNIVTNIDAIDRDFIAPKSFWNSFNDFPFEYELVPVYEGIGMVVGEAVVEEIYQIGWQQVSIDGEAVVAWKNNYEPIKNKYDLQHFVSLNDLGINKDIGYTNQKYAMKLTNIIKYEKPIPKEEFVLWNKVVDVMKSTPTYFAPDGECLENNDYFYEELEKGISQCDACVFDTGLGVTPQCQFKLVKEKLIVKSAPQGKIFVVERDD